MPLQRLRNALDYPLRQFFRWRRPGLHFRNEPKRALFAHLAEGPRAAAEAEAARLLETYHLRDFHAHSRAVNYRENLFYLEVLERALEALDAPLPDRLTAGDVGPSHWLYVQALWAGLRWWRAPAGRQVELTGYEADAYRVYADLHSRYDHALAHMRQLPGVRYEPRPFARQPAQFDLLGMFFPFVFQADHREWGLPDPDFDPAGLLAEVWASLKPGGALIIVNQGEAEHRAQKELLAAHAAPAAAYRHDSRLFEYDLPRYVLAARKMPERDALAGASLSGI